MQRLSPSSVHGNLSYARYAEKHSTHIYIENCMETPCWCPSRWTPMQHSGRKPTETFATKFRYKNVNLSLEGLKNIKIILFLLR